ncbi:uncharacterized protein N7483_010712 [Penicillium malachiteum]|uniref:uncharacterized protein n=1 Tax=Penicillium malachiteum TaxID=1324776 RepID=UPI002546957F|nr:uncharacterized protein N7483_010712 [Penicillium malachiteum]KAJ5713531.1 hypothetical protein N7483_010712 [Penicillium malachiteum]
MNVLVYLSPDPTTSSNLKEKPSRLGTASPFIYLKGIREITWGLNFLALQYYQQDFAITIFAGVVSLAELGDGWTVWANGGERLKMKAFGHLAVDLGTAAWFLWRALQ